MRERGFGRVGSVTEPAVVEVEDLGDAWRVFWNGREYIASGEIEYAVPGNHPRLVNKVSGEVTTDFSLYLIDAWANYVDSWDQHPPHGDFYYLRGLKFRDELEPCLHRCKQEWRGWVADADAQFAAITGEDHRLRMRFPADAAPGWWWDRMPLDPDAREDILGGGATD